ncbi:MAG: hypothetical protein RI101_04110 [Nitrospira sp.]|jgi:hypothetical protein|nr:hypothetical protein [Nitrospira sp.]
MTPDECNKWLEWVRVTSIPLKRIGPDNTPIDIASGCFVTCQDRRFILTVSHAVELGSSDWVIELGYDNTRGAEFYQGARFCYPGEINRRTGESAGADFAFAEVPADLESAFHLLTPFGLMSAKRQRHVFDLESAGNPDVDELYAFTGEIYPRLDSSGLTTQPVIYPGLRYVESAGAYHMFRLPVPHPGHDDFGGCSGAPIVDTKGNLVSLVSGGIIEKNVILGIALSRYKFAVEFYCKNIRPA